jgi:hypothetical protein
MSANVPLPQPPGTGKFRPDEGDRGRDDVDHMGNFNKAIQNALHNFGRAPGEYNTTLTLSAHVVVENPGNVVEYIATFS